MPIRDILDRIGRNYGAAKAQNFARHPLAAFIRGMAAREIEWSRHASHGSLMMIVKGAHGMIVKGKLPYVIKKERNDAGEITLGLHPTVKR